MNAVDPLLASEWADFWRGAIAAAPKRNAILHNPLTLNLHGMNQSVSDFEGIKQMNKPGSPLIRLGEVQAYVDEVRALNAQMLDLFKRTSF